MLPLLLSLLRFSPFSPAWFPVRSFPVPSTQLSVCFLSSFSPVSLPQPFHWCFPSAFASGTSPSFPLSFVRFIQVLTTQLSALSFPFFPFSPRSGSSGACLSASVPPGLPCFPSRFGTQLAAILFSVHVSPHSGYLRVSAFFLSASGLFPLVITLGSGYSALGMYPEN